MYVLDLFSGIGGFSLGLERAGFQTAAFCEIDPYCRRVLAKHWPGVPIHEDIRQLDGNRYAGTVDLVCGGYPCQPFSAAGKQRGEKDPRHLWPQMRRIIREARPAWVVAENVRGHLRLGFDAVASQLEDDGFTLWPFIIPACAVGAPHRRDRLWILAHHPGNGRREGRQGRLGSGGQGKSEPSLQALANPRGERGGGAGSGQAGRHESSDGREVLANTKGDGCGFSNPEWRSTRWSTEPDVGRVAHGIPNRVDRLRALGNAVVPPIPELIGQVIVAYGFPARTACSRTSCSWMPKAGPPTLADKSVDTASQFKMDPPTVEFHTIKPGGPANHSGD